MSEGTAKSKAQPIALGIIIGVLVATLIFVLATGDYGNPTPIEVSTEVEPVVLEEPVVVEAPPEPEPVPVFVPEPVAANTPSVSASNADSYARDRIGSVNGGKALEQFVAGDFVVERTVAIVDALRRGEVPYKLLPVGRPPKAFPITDDGLRVTMDPAGFSRYDGFANWINSLDAKAMALLFNEYESLATAALSQMGINDFDIRGAALAATTQILATPDVPDRAELVRKEANWIFADAELENLSALQKQLLRMGPENAEILQRKARELRAALLSDIS